MDIKHLLTKQEANICQPVFIDVLSQSASHTKGLSKITDEPQFSRHTKWQQPLQGVWQTASKHASKAEQQCRVSRIAQFKQQYMLRVPRARPALTIETLLNEYQTEANFSSAESINCSEHSSRSAGSTVVPSETSPKSSTSSTTSALQFLPLVPKRHLHLDLQTPAPTKRRAVRDKKERTLEDKASSKKRRLVNYELKLKSFVNRRSFITQAKMQRIEKLRKVIQEHQIDVQDRDLLIKHKSLFAAYGPDWFEALYYLNGVRVEVTDEQYKNVMKGLEKIAYSTETCRSADIMEMIISLLKIEGVECYYRYSRK